MPNVLVTGANRGIGLELVRQLALTLSSIGSYLCWDGSSLPWQMSL